MFYAYICFKIAKGRDFILDLPAVALAKRRRGPWPWSGPYIKKPVYLYTWVMSSGGCPVGVFNLVCQLVYSYKAF